MLRALAVFLSFFRISVLLIGALYAMQIADTVLADRAAMEFYFGSVPDKLAVTGAMVVGAPLLLGWGLGWLRRRIFERDLQRRRAVINRPDEEARQSAAIADLCFALLIAAFLFLLHPWAGYAGALLLAAAFVLMWLRVRLPGFLAAIIGAAVILVAAGGPVWRTEMTLGALVAATLVGAWFATILAAGLRYEQSASEASDVERVFE